MSGSSSYAPQGADPPFSSHPSRETDTSPISRLSHPQRQAGTSSSRPLDSSHKQQRHRDVEVVKEDIPTPLLVVKDLVPALLPFNSPTVALSTLLLAFINTWRGLRRNVAASGP